MNNILLQYPEQEDTISVKLGNHTAPVEIHDSAYSSAQSTPALRNATTNAKHRN